MFHSRLALLRICPAALALVVLSGCAEFEFMKWKKEQVPLVATAQHPAAECMCLWTPAEGRGVNGMPTRGFAGQILFFMRQNPSPVEIDGDVRIYVFDDQGTPEQRAKPIHQYDFTSQVWQSHLQASMLGTTYNVFIPYTRKGAHQAQCSLRLRFTPAGGGAPLYSEMVNVTLPGKLDETKAADQSKAEASKMSEAVQQRLGPLMQNGPKTNVSTIPTTGAPPPHPAVATPPSAATDPATSAVEPAGAGDARLQRVEQMLAQLLEEKQAAVPVPTAVPPQTPMSPATPGRRFKLQAAAQDGGEVYGAPMHEGAAIPVVEPVDAAAQSSGGRSWGEHPLLKRETPRRSHDAWQTPDEELAAGRLP